MSDFVAFARQPPPRETAAVEALVRRGTLNARVALWTLAGLGVILLATLALNGASPTTLLAAVAGIAVGGVPLWAPLVLHLRRTRAATRAAAERGVLATGTVVGSRTISVRGNPVTRVRFDLSDADGKSWRGVFDLPGARRWPEGAALEVLRDAAHPGFCLVGAEDLPPQLGRLRPLAEVQPARVALRLAIATVVGAGLLALFLLTAGR